MRRDASWPRTAEQAVAVQEDLRGLVDAVGPGPQHPQYVAGLDVAYNPRRFGLACHLGVLTGLPSIGVAKSAFVGTFEEPGPDRGDESDLHLDGELVGKVLRTQNKTKPVFVSVGHRVNLGTALMHVLHLASCYRLPETTRAADHACRQALKGFG